MIHIFGGGTVNYVRSHMALSAPAYGTTARLLSQLLSLKGVSAHQLELTKMADCQSRMETNDDVAARLDAILANPATKAIVFNVALCDFEGQIDCVAPSKYGRRVQSRDVDGNFVMTLTPVAKLLPRVKAQRPDVFLVGFKTSTHAKTFEQGEMALRQMRETGADIVLANDTGTRHNMLFANDGGSGNLLLATNDRDKVLIRLADLLAMRVAA